MKPEIKKQPNKANKKRTIAEIVKTLKEQGVNAQIIKKQQFLH